MPKIYHVFEDAMGTVAEIDHAISLLLKERGEIRARNREIAARLKALRMRRARIPWQEPATTTDYLVK
jgi:hypothetical protein